MAFDGIICSKIVYQLNKTILNGKINKIFEPNKNELLIRYIFNGEKLFSKY